MYEIQAPKPWGKPHPYGQREAELHAYDDAIEQIKLADEVGFDTVWLVEHHFREGRSHCPAPEVVIGALSQATRRIRLGFGVVLMPHGFTHPARVAEKVATADILSHGWVEWGTGRSTPMEQTAFGIPLETTRESWREAIKTIVAMWESERFSSDSSFLTFPERAITPKPFQDPHPPCWMAAVGDASYELAGRSGLGVLGLTTHKSAAQMGENIARYRAAIADPTPLTRVVNNQAGVYTLVHCAESMAQAEANDVWDSVWWWYQHLADFTIEWELAHLSEDKRSAAFPHLQEWLEGRFDPRRFNDNDNIIVGDPEQCLEKIERYAAAGADRLLCYMQFGHLSHESIMRSIALMGAEVIPALQRRVGRTTMPLGDGPAPIST